MNTCYVMRQHLTTTSPTAHATEQDNTNKQKTSLTANIYSVAGPICSNVQHMMQLHLPAPGEVIDSSLGGIVAGNGGDGHDSIDRGHVDDAASSTRLHLVLLYHLPGCCLPSLHANKKTGPSMTRRRRRLIEDHVRPMTASSFLRETLLKLTVTAELSC